MKDASPACAERLELRLPGLACPMPVLKAKKALAGLPAGGELELWSTDPHSGPDLEEFCRQTGHALLSRREADEDGKRWFVTLIRRKA